MSDPGSTTTPGGRRLPKVGVYVPRHRRGNDETSESGESVPVSTASSSPRRNPRSNNNGSKDDGPEDFGSARSRNSSSSEVQRRGRGKFMGPGGSGSSNTTGNGGGGTSRGNRESRGSGINSQGSSSSLVSQQQQPSVAAIARHPRGRDFDATVLRRYSDDENRPTSSFSRSSSYNSGRSNNNSSSGNNSSSAYSPNTRSAGRVYDSTGVKRSDRADEGSWRRDEPTSKAEEQKTEGTQNDFSCGISSALVDRLEQIQLIEDEVAQDETDSPEELEEWELALQDSDDDGIPRADSPKPPKPSKPHPAEHLLETTTAKTSKIGNWSEVANDDMYILELYGFSPSIKTMHLTDMFAPFENRSGGFRIKWLDDTRALVIFESAAVAKQAYIANITSQIAKIRPYTGADKDSIRNAGNPSSGAYNGVRPAKTDSVARRLVQGALGLRVRRTPEQIAEEKALVQAAKEARDAQRQEQQRQRQEMDSVFNS